MMASPKACTSAADRKLDFSSTIRNTSSTGTKLCLMLAARVRY